MTNNKQHPLQLKYCENCGTKDDLWYYKHVFSGITLCNDCADLPYSKVKRREVNWVRIENEDFPADLNPRHNPC